MTGPEANALLDAFTRAAELDAGLAAAEAAHHEREARPVHVTDAPTVRLPCETMRQVVYPEDCDATNGVDERHFNDGMGG